MVLCWQPSMTPSLSASQPPETQANSIASFTLGQMFRSQFEVPSETPLAVKPHDRPHLPVGGREVPLLGPRDGQVRAEAHQAAVVGRIDELQSQQARLAGPGR